MLILCVLMKVWGFHYGFLSNLFIIIITRFYFRSHAGELISLPGILAAVQRSVFSVIIR